MRARPACTLSDDGWVGSVGYSGLTVEASCVRYHEIRVIGWDIWMRYQQALEAGRQ